MGIRDGRSTRALPYRFGAGRRRRDDDGLTLVEVLVAMTLTALLLTALGQVVISASKAARFTMSKTSTAAAARTAVERMSKIMRVTSLNYKTDTVDAGSFAFEAASYDSVTFYALIKTDTGATDPIPTKVQYYWDSTAKCLTEVLTKGRALVPEPSTGSPYAWDATPTKRCLVKMATAPTLSAPLFTYYDSVTLDNSGNPPTPLPVTSTGMAAADRPKIRSIEISLSAVDPANTSAPPAVYLDKVSLDNLLVTGDDS